MGWNDWYTHYDRVTADLIRRAASAWSLPAWPTSAYQYVNIDDCWMVEARLHRPRPRGEPRGRGRVDTSQSALPRHESLTAFIHRPGPEGRYLHLPWPAHVRAFTRFQRHEEADARSSPEWGFDFLKYDWCSYERVPVARRWKTQASLRADGRYSAKLDRDVVFQPLPVRH